MIANITRVLKILLLIGMVAAPLACSGPDDDSPRFVRTIQWIGTGTWLKVDTHVHSTFSDGMHSIDELVMQAQNFGCDAVAITDHADLELQAATEAYMQAIYDARDNHRGIIVLAGLEWNIPPWDGREHATVVLPLGPHEGEVLNQFKTQFDGLGQWQNDPLKSIEALKWLHTEGASSNVLPIVIYNHPSRKRASSIQLVSAIYDWHRENEVLIGFSGAPAHQLSDPIGSYNSSEKTIDRWDPAAARVGDAWDTLLQKGVDVFAARAPSDFHSRPELSRDYWPGQFSATWIYAPEYSDKGILRAFHAGAFFAAHGHIARRVILSVHAFGLPRPAWPGEIIKVKANTVISVRIEMVIPVRDWEGKPNHIDMLELIAVTRDDARIISEARPSSEGPAMSETVAVPPGGLVLRARGRRVVENGPDLIFYTNPIRILASAAE